MSALLAALLMAGAPAWSATPADPHRTAHTHGRQVGKASIYSHRLAGRRTASGQPFDPHRKTAASKTLPLGTKATVTNLENGRSTDVEVTDRGPNVPGRIMDVSPQVAQELQMNKAGVAPVEVKPKAPGAGP